MIEQRVRDLVIHHGIGPEDDAEGLVRGILALVAETEERLREFAEDVVRQFGYWSAGSVGGYTAGGLSTLEEAFEILGWDDPHPDEFARCDEPGCTEQANCGWPSRPGGTGLNGGYRHTCGPHMRARQDKA